MGLDVYLSNTKLRPVNADADWRKVELPSVRFPDHLFKVGYWRSSYNHSGFDHVMCERLGADATLAAIAGATDDSYEHFPDWYAIIERAKDVKERWIAAGKSVADQLRVIETMLVGPNSGDAYPYDSERELLDEVAGEIADDKDAFLSAYHSGKKSFFRDGIPVVAVALVKRRFGGTALALVSKVSSEHLDWYTQALDIVIETAEYVLAQDDPSEWYLIWSG